MDSRLVWKLPHFLSYEDGATLGVGLVTAGIILYKSFGFELTSNPVKKSSPGTILIWGGATVVGIYIIQLAKIIGLKVITVASSDNESYLRELGSDEVIDRFLPIEEIKNKIQGRIDYGVDCVSKETSQLVLEVLGENAGTSKLKPLFAGIVGLPKEYPENVEFRETVIKQFHEDVGYGNDFVKVTTEFLTARKLQPVRYKSYNGGLGSIHKGLLDLEAIGAKAEKYVVSV